ncbi:MAG: YgiQ family radical SAM protein, partial [Candidatus Cloacimonetes bacterium]|nr:YgiQ family radical SAM protein [Candidatus Cloacimonadota bacterium]
MTNHFLPVSKKEMDDLGWEQADIILVSGDAYVDHPSFAAAIIGRYLESLGYKVGIIAQPNIQDDSDFTALGTPRLFFGITSGNMDSMVNHYTAQNKIRTDDAYSPDGLAGLRPNRAVMIYTQKIKT